MISNMALLITGVWASLWLQCCGDEQLQLFHKLNKTNFLAYQNEPVSTLINMNYVAMAIPEPSNLIHFGNAVGSNAIVGIAVYHSFFEGFRKIVGTLRRAQFSGQIILGVQPDLPQRELIYLKKMNVTLYSVNIVDCDASISAAKVQGAIRGKCAEGLENLKLEWGRFELARQWLNACSLCTGWSLVMDTRDVFFQDDPFIQLGNPFTAPVDLLFIEEISPVSSPSVDPKRSFVCRNFRNAAHTIPCYGKQSYELYGDKPVLCSGTVIGNRPGIMRFLDVLVTEFHRNNVNGNPKCQSPSTTDQWTMNWLYYHGKFGDTDRTATVPWGVGPVLTVGKACMTADRKQGATDLITRDRHRLRLTGSGGQGDGRDGSNNSSWNSSPLTTLSPVSSSALLVSGGLVNHLDGRLAAVVHQYDRCGDWIKSFFSDNNDHFHYE